MCKSMCIITGVDCYVKGTYHSNSISYHMLTAFELTIKKTETLSRLVSRICPLIEPNKKYNDGDLVLFLSHELTTLGRIYPYQGMTILLPLNNEPSPLVLKKGGIEKSGVKILRVSEIRQKY